MAVPALLNNSPSAGYISWSPFTIQLYGVAYSVPAASSNKRWVWWEYKNGAPIINAGADLPLTLTDDDLVLFGNKNGIGVRVQSTNFVDGELLVDGSIFAEALSTNLISTQHIVTAGLDAGVIKFGVMHGDRIEADTITATQIAADTITANEIAADTITANEIAASTITANEIAGGTITGDKIAGNTITANEIDSNVITGDLLASEVVMSGLVRAGELDEDGEIVSGYSEMGSLGILTVDSAGETVASFPTDAGNAAYLRAHVDLLSAEVRDNFTMHGTNNLVAVESELTLAAGVESPSTPPILTQVWDTLQLNKTTAVAANVPNPGFNLGTFAFNPAQATSIAWDSLWSCWVVIQQKSNGFRIWRFTATGALFLNFTTGRPWVDDFNDKYDASLAYNSSANGCGIVCRMGDDWWFLGHSNVNKIPASWYLDVAGRPPFVSYDAVNNQYMLVQSDGGPQGPIHIRRFTQTAGANNPNATSQSTISFEAASGMARRVNGAVFGSQMGLPGYVINVDEYPTAYAFSPTGVSWNDDGSYRNWVKPGAALGLTHNGTQFASLDASGVITFYTDWTWTGLDATVWVGASAFDSDTAGDQANPHPGQLAGQHETPVGTMKSINLYRRSKLQITMPETNDSGGNDDADKWRLYFKRGGGTAPTDKTLLKLAGQIGSPTSQTSTVLTADPTGASPPGGIKGQVGAYNNFPGADPGRLESSVSDTLGPLIQVLGDGTCRLGDLSIISQGRAVISSAGLLRPESTYAAQYKWQLKGDGSGNVGPFAWGTDGKPTYTTPVTSGVLTATTGWRVDSMDFRRYGPIVAFACQFTRTGANISLSVPDHVNQTIGNIAAAWVPVQTCMVPTNQGFRHVALTGGGQVVVTGGMADSSLANTNIVTNDIISLSGIYLLDPSQV